MSLPSSPTEPTSYKNQRTNKEVFLFIDNRIDPSCFDCRSFDWSKRDRALVDLKNWANVIVIASPRPLFSPLVPRRPPPPSVPRRGSWRSLRRGTFRGRFALRLITSLLLWSSKDWFHSADSLKVARGGKPLFRSQRVMLFRQALSWLTRFSMIGMFSSRGKNTENTVEIFRVLFQKSKIYFRISFFFENYWVSLKIIKCLSNFFLSPFFFFWKPGWKYRKLKTSTSLF